MFDNWQKLVSLHKICAVPEKYVATYYPNRMKEYPLTFFFVFFCNFFLSLLTASVEGCQGPSWLS